MFSLKRKAELPYCVLHYVMIRRIPELWRKEIFNDHIADLYLLALHISHQRMASYACYRIPDPNKQAALQTKADAF